MSFIARHQAWTKQALASLNHQEIPKGRLVARSVLTILEATYFFAGNQAHGCPDVSTRINGTTIHLNKGDLIVEAIAQQDKSLYVQTKDVMQLSAAPCPSSTQKSKGRVWPSSKVQFVCGRPEQK